MHKLGKKNVHYTSALLSLCHSKKNEELLLLCDAKVNSFQYMNSIFSCWHRLKVWGFYNLRGFFYSVFVHVLKILLLADWWKAQAFTFFIMIENILMDESSCLQLKQLKLLDCDAEFKGKFEILLSRTLWYNSGKHKNSGNFSDFQAQTIHGSLGSKLL